MIKILDYINKRDIEVNTKHGAEKAVEILLRNAKGRMNHSKSVSKVAKLIALEMGLTEDLVEKVEIASLLHDIGYSDDFKFAHFHPVDGYFYLKYNGWDKLFQTVALHHSLSKNLAETTRKDVISIYNNCEYLTEEEELIVNIVSEADFQVNSIGNIVSFEERLQDIKERYGENTPISKNAEDIYSHVVQLKIKRQQRV